MSRIKGPWRGALCVGALISACGCASVEAPGPSPEQEQRQQRADELARTFKPDIMLVSRCAAYYAQKGTWPRVREVFSSQDPQVKEAFAALVGDAITFRKNDAGNLEITIVPAKNKASTDKTMNEMFPITGKRALEVFSRVERKGAFRARYLGEDPPFSGTFTVKPSPIPPAE